MSMDKANVEDILLSVSMTVAELRVHFKTRQILGGVFGTGGYSMSSMWSVRDGLHYVMYFVTHDRTQVALAVCEAKAECLRQAREFMESVGPVGLPPLLGRVEGRLQQALQLKWEELERKREERRAAARKNLPAPVKSIPTRRRQIFEASGGKCHYCSSTLTLDGLWHIEHKMPKALMGTNAPSNLVASCAPCNFKKRDSTDIEFIAAQQKATDAA